MEMAGHGGGGERECALKLQECICIQKRGEWANSRAHKRPPWSRMGLSRQDVADWLLQESYLLTALEFHTELLESGTDLEILSSFFSNPANFESEAVDCLCMPELGRIRW